MPRPLTRLLLLTLPFCSGLGGCEPSSPGSMSHALFQARAREYLVYATQSHGNGPLNAIAHMERDRVDPGYQAPVGHVGVGSWAGDFARIATYEDTRDFGGLYMLNALLGYEGHPYLTPEFWEEVRQILFSFKMWYTDATPAVPDPADPDRDWDNSFYWTENHQILYHVIEFLLGQRYPGQCFTQVGFAPTGTCDGVDSLGRPYERTGAQHRARARPLIERWFEDRWNIGYAEWHSNIYYQKDVTPLLTLVEFSEDEEIAERAAILLDQILLELATHTHMDTFGVTHGRSAMKDKWWGPRNDTWGIVHLLFRQQQQLGYFSTGDPGATLLARASKYRLPEAVRQAGISKQTFVDRQRHSVFIDETPSAPDAPAPFVGPFHGEPGYMPEVPQFAPDFDVDFPSPGAHPYEGNFTFWWGLGAWTAWQVVPLTVATGDVYNLWNTNLLRDFQDLRALLGPLDEPVPEGNIGIGQTLALQLAPLATVGLLKEANTYTYRSREYMLSTVQDYRKGYNVGQVHSWNLTIDPAAMVFTTHPMNDVQPPSEWWNRDEGEPGYWTGSASSPRSAQHMNVGIHLYSPAYPDGGALGFFDFAPHTHAYLPQDAFDEVVQDGPWTFARKGRVYVALYSWRGTSWQDYAPDEYDILNGILDGLAPFTFQQSFDLVADGPPPPGVADPSIAVQGPDNAWIVEVGTRGEWGSFGAFRSAIAAAAVTVTPSPGPVLANQTIGTPLRHQHFEVVYDSPSQGLMTFGWAGDLTVAGSVVPIRDHPRFDNPWIRMERGAPQALIQAGPWQVLHDWQAATRTLLGPGP